MKTDLPAREYLDEAAKAAGSIDWGRRRCGAVMDNSIIAHARTLEEKAALELRTFDDRVEVAADFAALKREKAALQARLAKYEPPVDPITAEVRECMAQRYGERGLPGLAAAARDGEYDDSGWANLLRIRISREKEHPL